MSNQAGSGHDQTRRASIDGSASFADLLSRTDAPSGSAWFIFGENDELGSLNRLTSEQVLRAASLVRTGRVFNLDYPLDAFDFPHRPKPVHTVFHRNRNHSDDYLDSLYLQCSSQIDGLRHFRHPTAGYYNGVRDEEVTPNSPTLGINRWAEHGIVGRGVLVDLERFRRNAGLCPTDEDVFDVAEIEQAADEQGVKFESGDVLILRTGWASRVLERIRAGSIARNAVTSSPGLRQSSEMVEWLWDRQFSMVAADNRAVEKVPPVADSPFVLEFEPDAESAAMHGGMLHRVLIPLFGLALGELWSLDELAEDCVADGKWELMICVKPLFLTGGVGSPANAMAIK